MTQPRPNETGGRGLRRIASVQSAFAVLGVGRHFPVAYGLAPDERSAAIAIVSSATGGESKDVLCQAMAGCSTDRGCWRGLSAARRAAGVVTAAPAIRWVAARSGQEPHGSGMVTVMCCCSPVWRAGS
jgi:hypothetical protein